MNCVINTFGKHEAKLRGFSTRQSGSPVQADDILQKTFLCTVSQGEKSHDQIRGLFRPSLAIK